MTVVTFVADVYPYCKGDVMDLSKDELKLVDAVATERDITAYEKGETKVEADETVEETISAGDVEAEKNNAEAEAAQIKRAEAAGSPVKTDVKTVEKTDKK